ncbi:disrupted in schizophrenia 1 protein isoform X1 [Xyrichtys novacula]|uniref:Disrupted in schizophrenia 1 protein isoform X1 n=1 Tax=Xyrichtys novacula TaxID=13765 RepID=A0AAV1G4S0_XYRNO|nr:disrupted in schizophrenia 1 protein isoform X1 [Xyrichtys novacula]
MFAGLMGFECRSASLLHHREVMEGGRPSGTAGSSGRKRFHRRPGYMRGEPSRLQSSSHGQEEEEEEEEEEEGGNTSCIRNGRHTDEAPAVRETLKSQEKPDKLSCSTRRSKSGTCPLSPEACWELIHSSTKNKLRSNPSPAAPESSTQDSFNSSFSFIQQSLNSSSTPSRDPEPLNHSTKALQTTPAPLPIDPSTSKRSSSVQSDPPSDRDELSGGRSWRVCLWGDTEVTSDLPDGDDQSVDIEIISSLSVDSDTASASSVTSGYESATPASDHGVDNLVKKYEVVLQDCLQNNRTHTKIESMMLKLQRLQQKAILDDDYDAAERFGKKLEELCRERGALKLGLPSTQPSVALFLQRLTQVVYSALQRTDCSQCRDGVDPDAGELCESLQGPLYRRDRLIQEKRLVEEEMLELQRRLAELKDRSLKLDQQIQQEEQRAEAEELEGSVLRSYSVNQLREMSRTLQDLVSSENRTQISVSPPPSMIRLQEQEQALNLSIKEATAKVVMSQRLGSSLRRKVSETETQLLTLHEAKLAAISGNDFSSAKELKAEMKAVYLERDRLEALAKRLHSLSAGSSQELSRMKEQRQQLRQELEQREAQHENRLKENTTKYMKLLEDRLHSCGCPGLERIWEADLEACHLFLRGLQLRTPSCSGADIEDLPSAAAYPPTQPSTKEEEDCAMLTALGGRWCPEANLQHSEFTKKLEEFLFCMEENHPEDVCGETEAADLTERCELISDRLMTLEDELQTAILNQDQALTHILSKEVQEVKATLQTMLAQLREEEEEEDEDDDGEEDEGEELQDDDLMKNGTEEEEEREEEEEEEEEDQYFSDSWGI